VLGREFTGKTLPGFQFVRREIDTDSFINDNDAVYEIRHYLTQNDKDVFMEWRQKLRDTQARVAVDRRINRIEIDNFGDHRFCRDGVWELRIDVGQGYRIYYAFPGAQLVLLLCGGDKRTQDADIDRACEYWADWQKRS
jgi:putative addiction module killer protein